MRKTVTKSNALAAAASSDSGELDRDRRPLAVPAGHPDRAAVEDHDLLRQRQAETESVRLGRLEGKKEPGGLRVVDADPVVADRDASLRDVEVDRDPAAAALPAREL